MIKVPATEAGIPAIEELTARGVNVNVTLLFSRRALRAGDRRLHRGPRAAPARRRARGRDRLGRLVLRLARRRQGRRAAARRLGPARPRRDRQRPNAPTGATASASPTSAGSTLHDAGAQPAAPAVGQHRHQGPRLLRRALRRGARRARRRSTRCPRRRCARSPTTATPRGASAGAPAPPSRRSAALAGRGRRPRRHHRASSNAKASRRSAPSYEELLDCIETQARAGRARSARRIMTRPDDARGLPEPCRGCSSPAVGSRGSRRCWRCVRWPAIASTSRSSRPS